MPELYRFTIYKLKAVKLVIRVEREAVTNQKQEPKWSMDMTENVIEDKLSDQMLESTMSVNTNTSN